LTIKTVATPEIYNPVGKSIVDMTNYVDIASISVRFNAVGLLARNLLQGGKERQSAYSLRKSYKYQNVGLRFAPPNPHLFN
jgi:hypothetical protein